ncbi:MAG: ABC transporter permease [Clostridiales bacterium]|nr:ABC transporter permease [Bacillota bacterium]MCR5005075.1 ABC transporter permease [Clostridiales bacterium]
MKKNILKNEGVQSLIASLICIVLGLLIGFIVLLFINPAGAFDAILAVIKNYFTYSRANLQLKNFGNTLVQTAPLLMCSLSILFCYKVGLFNIGCAGQYVVGACASIYGALALGLPWWAALLFAIVAGAIYGAVVGLLKAYCNVNEVISGIMLNWIGLYTTNMILSAVKEETSPYTLHLKDYAASSILPTLGLDKLFANNSYVSLSIPLAILVAIALKVILDQTKFGYELKATGFNKNAAKYAGMAEKRNIIVTLAIGGALAAAGGALFYLTDFEQWSVTASTVPGMGFNGIAAAFLGGLNPIGTIFSSYFIQHITRGGAFVDKTLYSAQISDLISAIIIYLCGFVGFLKLAMKKGIAAKEEKKNSTKGADA